MKKDINPNFITWLLNTVSIVVIVGIVLLLLTAVFSCNPAKQAARKDQKALDRVMTSPSLLKTAYGRGAELWPCANDTTFIFKPGRIDSMYLPVMFDTTDRDRIKDSILAIANDDCNDQVKAAFDMGVDVTEKKYSKIKVPVYRPDTLAGFIVDGTLAKRLMDSLHEKDKLLSNWSGRAEEWAKWAAKTEAVNQKKQSTQFWVIVGLVVALILSNGAWAYFKFKKPL